ncbi:MAG: glutaredoxin domain-containing protein [Myxococcota bacterium]
MSREILPEDKIHPAIRDRITNHFRETVAEVQQAVENNELVVVGMAQNPFPKKARKSLDERGIQYRYLEYGSYTSSIKTWRRRNALKMWTGWPTFPMVFHKGVLVGGADDLARLLKSGELD